MVATASQRQRLEGNGGSRIQRSGTAVARWLEKQGGRVAAGEGGIRGS